MRKITKYVIDGMELYTYKNIKPKEEKEWHWSIELLIIVAFVAAILAMWVYKI